MLTWLWADDGMKECLTLKLSEGSAQPKGSLSGAARRDGGCVSKHDKFHRDGTVQPYGEARTYLVHRA